MTRWLPFTALLYSPIICSIGMIAWTEIISDFSNYGDTWAILPILFTFLVIIILHVTILINKSWGPSYIIFAVVHIPISFMIGIYCFSRISKDSL